VDRAVFSVLQAGAGEFHERRFQLEDLASPTLSVDDAERLANEAHARYQSADYAAAARVLTGLIPAVDMAVADASHDNVERCLRAQHAVYPTAHRWPPYGWTRPCSKDSRPIR
jgi:hypothetical protein